MAQQPQPHNAQPANPIITKLRETPGASPAQFTGWVGSGAADGRTRLHLDVGSLSYYLEFDNADVLHWADVPETVMPLGAKMAWVRGDARVRVIRSVGAKAIQVSRFLQSSGQASGSDAVRGFLSGATLNTPRSKNQSSS